MDNPVCIQTAKFHLPLSNFTEYESFQLLKQVSNASGIKFGELVPDEALFSEKLSVENNTT